MTNSSDWIAALSRGSEASSSQNWVEALLDTADGERGFVEGMPFNRRSHTPPTPTEAPAPELADINPPIDPVQDAFARGEAAGRTAAEREFQSEREQARSLRFSFRALDQAAMDALALELSETVIALCEQVIDEFEPPSEALKARCLEAAQRLGSAADGCTLHLHPEDIAAIDAHDIGHWRIVEDASIERGSLRFESADGTISDGPADWRRAIAAAIRCQVR